MLNTIDSKPIAPQRMTNPPEARKFKTLAAAHSYLRKFLEHKGDILIKLVIPDWLPQANDRINPFFVIAYAQVI